jgi:hypothetical protein
MLGNGYTWRSSSIRKGDKWSPVRSHNSWNGPTALASTWSSPVGLGSTWS